MTTTRTNPDTAPQILQTYTLLQIAAEAMFGVRHDKEAAAVGSGAFSVDQIADAILTKGNDYSSKMTTAQAAEFAVNWTVLSHQPNTAKGFSATLFQYVGVNDASRGLTANQLVVSFRSKEFIEDYARDNRQTNTFEISDGGWAYGQLSDMVTWFERARLDNVAAFTVAGGKVDVTGYSLGGHLATAFNRMYGGIGKVYTFNAAGVGNLLPQYSHDGHTTKVFIEAQPLMRGSYLFETFKASLAALELRHAA